MTGNKIMNSMPASKESTMIPQGINPQEKGY
jgi:hypothetical protein